MDSRKLLILIGVMVLVIIASTAKQSSRTAAANLSISKIAITPTTYTKSSLSPNGRWFIYAAGNLANVYVYDLENNHEYSFPLGELSSQFGRNIWLPDSSKAFLDESPDAYTDEVIDFSGDTPALQEGISMKSPVKPPAPATMTCSDCPPVLQSGPPYVEWERAILRRIKNIVPKMYDLRHVPTSFLPTLGIVWLPMQHANNVDLIQINLSSGRAQAIATHAPGLFLDSVGISGIYPSPDGLKIFYDVSYSHKSGAWGTADQWFYLDLAQNPLQPAKVMDNRTGPANWVTWQADSKVAYGIQSGGGLLKISIDQSK